MGRLSSILLLLCLFGVNICHAVLGECYEFDVTSNTSGKCGFRTRDCLLPVEAKTCGTPNPKPQSVLATGGEADCRSAVPHCNSGSASCLQDNGPCLDRGAEIGLVEALEQSDLECLKKMGYTFVAIRISNPLDGNVAKALANAYAVFGKGRFVLVYNPYLTAAASAEYQLKTLYGFLQKNAGGDKMPARIYFPFENPFSSILINQGIVKAIAQAAKSLQLPIGFQATRDSWGSKINIAWPENDAQYLWLRESDPAIWFEDNFYGFKYGIKDYDSAKTPCGFAVDELVVKEM